MIRTKCPSASAARCESSFDELCSTIIAKPQERTRRFWYGIVDQAEPE
jgi:hypothetical protein